MKVILVNGSPHEKGCTYTALTEIQKTLEKNKIETEIFWVGNKPISGCLGCGNCIKTGKCFMEDKVNEFLEKVPEADGFVFGTPVHFASGSGMITSFMDRAFYGICFQELRYGTSQVQGYGSGVCGCTQGVV